MMTALDLLNLNQLILLVAQNMDDVNSAVSRDEGAEKISDALSALARLLHTAHIMAEKCASAEKETL